MLKKLFKKVIFIFNELKIITALITTYIVHYNVFFDKAYIEISESFNSRKASNSRISWDLRLFTFLNKIDKEGDIVEIGVASGRSLAFILLTCQILKKNNKVIGLDTFEGFPESSIFDKLNPRMTHTSYKKYTIEYVQDYLAGITKLSTQVISKLTLIKGLVPESFYSHSFNQISLLHLDCDLYECHKESLYYLFDYFRDGTYILLDDYCEKKWPGVKIAVDEFCNDFNQKVERDRFFLNFIRITK